MMRKEIRGEVVAGDGNDDALQALGYTCRANL